MIHFLLSIPFIFIGYPIGVYAITNWLNVPPDRLVACIWIFRISLISFFISVVVVPYMAMFVAMQQIFVMVGFNFVQVIGNVIVAYSLLGFEGDRLIAYSTFLLLLTAVSYLLPIAYAIAKFPSCRICWNLMCNVSRVRSMLSFTGWKCLGDMAWGIKSYGSSFLVNIQFGPIVNAAMSVANQVAAQAESLSRTLANAFSPAITSEEGSGNRQRVVDFALKTCKFGSVLLLLLAIPFLSELDYWLVLWLKNPPKYSGFLCACLLVSNIITYLTKGHQLAIQANGNISQWQIFDALSYISALPLALIFIWMGFGVCSIGYAFIISISLTSINRIIFAKILLAVSPIKWYREVFVPILVTAIISMLIARGVANMIQEGICQLIVVGIIADLSVCILALVFVFKQDEKAYMSKQIKRICIWRH